MDDIYKIKHAEKGLNKNQDFLHIHNIYQLNESELFDTSALIIDITNEAIIKKMLQRIRRMRYKSFYLKPVFLAEGEFSPEIISQTDGLIKLEELPSIMDKVAKINKRVTEVRTVTARYTFSESLLIKTLQYLYTRNTELIPFRDRSATISYCFPFISSVVTAEDHVTLLDVLEKGMMEGFLEGTLMDRVNLCKTCDGSYHNFREVCPKCNSIDLESVDLLHHFRCAYIGPATDFNQGGALICPKCDKEMRHIGIDYDKPSEIFNCNACNHQAQQPNMTAHCIDCGTENELEYLKTKAISSYRMTAYGQEIAEHGLQKVDAEKIPKIDDQRILPFDTWQVMLRHEIERIKLKKINSKVISVEMNKDLMGPMDADTQRDLKREILKELTSYIRPVDLVTSNTLTEIFVLFPDIKNKEIANMADIFDYNITKMVGDNLGQREEIVKIIVHDINEDLINFGE